MEAESFWFLFTAEKLSDKGIQIYDIVIEQMPMEFSKWMILSFFLKREHFYKVSVMKVCNS